MGDARTDQVECCARSAPFRSLETRLLILVFFVFGSSVFKDVDLLAAEVVFAVLGFICEDLSYLFLELFVDFCDGDGGFGKL